MCERFTTCTQVRIELKDDNYSKTIPYTNFHHYIHGLQPKKNYAVTVSYAFIKSFCCNETLFNRRSVKLSLGMNSFFEFLHQNPQFVFRAI